MKKEKNMNQTFQKMTLSLSLFAASLAYAQDQQEGSHVPSTTQRGGTGYQNSQRKGYCKGRGRFRKS